MMYGATLGDWALFLGGIAVLITAVGGSASAIISALHLGKKVDRIEKGVEQSVHELRTLNGSTVGQLADADESRRVELIPPHERTAGEAEHIAVVPPPPDAP